MCLDKNPQKIESLFDKISNYYDKMNNLMSLGTHYIIKILALKILKIKPKSNVLDICCGTGDFTSIISKIEPRANVIGLDFSTEMIKLAQKKNPKKVFIEGDVTNLPFKEGEFDFVTSGFGLRNIENRQRALIEINRVLKKGGKFLHLDFGIHNLLWKLFDKFVPYFVKFSGIDKGEYEYLICSKNDFPEPDKLIEEFEECGFKFLNRKDFLFGAISVQVMVKN